MLVKVADSGTALQAAIVDQSTIFDQEVGKGTGLGLLHGLRRHQRPQRFGYFKLSRGQGHDVRRTLAAGMWPAHKHGADVPPASVFARRARGGCEAGRRQRSLAGEGADPGPKTRKAAR